MSLNTGGPVNFKPRPIEGAPVAARSVSPRSLLFDGQQRMTSLYQVTLRNQVVETVTVGSAVVVEVGFALSGMVVNALLLSSIKFVNPHRVCGRLGEAMKLKSDQGRVEQRRPGLATTDRPNRTPLAEYGSLPPGLIE
jgi:hypothetical protein